MKVAAIVGGTHGMGLATAIKFAHEGYKVYVCGRSAEKWRQAQSVLRNFNVEDKITFTQCDVRDLPTLQQFAGFASQDTGYIDIAVDSAAQMNKFKQITDLDLEVKLPPYNQRGEINTPWDTLMTNYVGVFNFLKAFIPFIRDNSGSIIIVSSIAGQTPDWGNAIYASSKAATDSLIRSAAQDVSKRRIKVLGIAPTWVNTGFGAGAATGEFAVNRAKSTLDMHSFMQPDHMEPSGIANTIWNLSNINTPFVTGSVIKVDGGRSNTLML